MRTKVSDLTQQYSKYNYYISGILITMVIIIDQITKYFVKTRMVHSESIPILGDFFRLTYVENRGMAFGIQLGNQFVFQILSIIAVIVVIYYLVLALKEDNILMTIALSLILGGAIGNLVDRIFFGSVVDFLDFEFFNISIPTFKLLFINFPGYYIDRWYVFNLADSAVTCGMILIGIIIFIAKDKTKKEIVN